MQFLTESQALGALRRGAAIEQARVDVDSDGTFSWPTAQRVGDHIILRLHVVHDEGTDDFLDVTEFSPWGGAELGTFSSEDRLLAAAAVGAVADRWLNAGMVQDLYAERRGSSSSSSGSRPVRTPTTPNSNHSSPTSVYPFRGRTRTI